MASRKDFDGSRGSTEEAWSGSTSLIPRCDSIGSSCARHGFPRLNLGWIRHCEYASIHHLYYVKRRQREVITKSHKQSSLVIFLTRSEIGCIKLVLKGLLDVRWLQNRAPGFRHEGSAPQPALKMYRHSNAGCLVWSVDATLY